MNQRPKKLVETGINPGTLNEASPIFKMIPLEGEIEAISKAFSKSSPTSTTE